jgi:CRISPR-associated endonuclease/helicase Cas3
MAAHARGANAQMAFELARAIEDGAAVHDLGKLDAENQAALHAGPNLKMPWDHVDAGTAHLLAQGAGTAAWIVRSHHAPGLPSCSLHFSSLGRNSDQVRMLRGRRADDEARERHQEQKDRTDRTLVELLRDHTADFGESRPMRGKTAHGLRLRLALSCLVDADHADTTAFYNPSSPPAAPAPRWEERLAALDAYVARLAMRASQRNPDRADFYDACRNREPDAGMAACEGPVGIGKTTAVTAYLLRRAITTGARRLVIVAPYTAILSQTAHSLRGALTLKDEVPEQVVAEHHHRADFEDIMSRDLAVLWQAPIILTTAVQFFETLASNQPAALRKLHALRGSVVFIDEAHAAIPAPLWPQNWGWLRSLAEDWGCSFVFASGSLARFWENRDIVGKEEAGQLPQLETPDLARRLTTAERQRVIYRTLGRLDGPKAIAHAVLAAPGPRLLILNTVQSAAVMASHLRETGHEVLHISTALCPTDRERVLERIRLRLADEGKRDWTLVATSLVEAGIDLSFRSALRERFSTASLIQVGGRVNRHSELDEAAVVYDFFFDSTEFLKCHPAAKTSGDVLRQLFEAGRLGGAFTPADLVTDAMRLEIKRHPRSFDDSPLIKAEREKDYPTVAVHGRVIDAEARLVVVTPTLRDQILARERLSSRMLLAGSVQIWSRALDRFGLEPIHGRSDIYWWPHPYDQRFLGYMKGALGLQTGEAFII